MSARRRWIGWLAGALLGAGALAAEAALDGDLLEFLGSVDSEGDGWGDYLARTDVSRVSPPSPKVPGAEHTTLPPADAKVVKP